MLSAVSSQFARHSRVVDRQPRAGRIDSRFRELRLEPLERRLLLEANPGILNIAGDLTIDGSDQGVIAPPVETTGGTVQIEIGGLAPGTGYDQINVTEDVFLLPGGDQDPGCKLEVVLFNEFQPEVGQTFSFLTYGGDIHGKFDTASGMFGFGDGSLYFEIVETPTELQLEVKEVPSELQFEPDTADEDGFGEFLSDYFDTANFTFTGGLSVPGFVEMSGSFTISNETDGFTVVATDINAFLGTGGETPQTTDDTGFSINNVELGLRMFTPSDAPNTYALAASGNLALLGLDGLNISGNATIQVNTHYATVDLHVGTDTVSAIEGVQALTAHVDMNVGETLTLSGDLTAIKTRSGAVFVDIPDVTLSINIPNAGWEEVFQIGGGVRFSMGGDEGLRLLDMGLTSVSVFGFDLLASAGAPLVPLGDGDPGEAPDGFAVELTSLPGLAIDANVLNRRQYIDVTFFAPSGTNVDHGSIDSSDLVVTGDGVLDAEVSSVELLEGDTFRYQLRDRDTSNEDDLFGVGTVQVGFSSGSWQNDVGAPSTAESFDVEIRDGAATGTKTMSAGPLTIEAPHIGIEDFQYKVEGGGGRLTITVGIGAGQASLDFGDGQSSSGVTVQLEDVLGTFQLGANVNVNPFSLDNWTGGFGFEVGELVAKVPNVIFTASDVSVNYDPQKDTDGDGTVSPDEQQAYENREIIGIGTASIDIPNVGVKGGIKGLSVRNNGFSLDNAELTLDKTFKVKNILELNGVTVGLADFGVTFDQAADFEGEIFVASGGAKLFPGKKISATITDANEDGEAVRCGLTFTDGEVDGFTFAADQFALEFGSYLTVTGSGVLIDTGAADDEEVAAFASLGAKLNAGPLKLSGEMRNFAFMGDGEFKTKDGFGVSFNRDSADSKSFKWPSWLPIRITSVDARWKNFKTDPTDFQIIVSAAVTGLHKLPMKVSGAVEGLVIDVGLLLDGKFPITGMESFAVGLDGKLFGGKAKGALLGGIIRFDSEGNRIPENDNATAVEDRVLFVGLDAGFTMAGVGGFGLKMAFSELGPLGVMISASTPTGILLEPTSGLTINDFVAGVEFFKSLPALTEPQQLRDTSLDASAEPDDGAWKAWQESAEQQVVQQYQVIQANPNQAGFLTAFTEPMTITAGATIYSQYTSKYSFNGQVELRLSTDGKFLATGKLNFFGGALSTAAKLYANLSEIAKGNATILLLADIPEQFRFLVLQGKFQMAFQNDSGDPMEFDSDAPDDTSLPVANLAGPANGSTVGLVTFRGRGYLDVSYLAKNGRTINADSITDPDDEFTLLSDGTVLTIGDSPTLLSDPDANPAIYRYTYSLPTGAELVPGEVEIQFLDGSFADNDAQTNQAETESFFLGVPQAELSLPTDGGLIDLHALNSAGYITVRFRPTPGAILDTDSLRDGAPEIQLTGNAAIGVTLNEDPIPGDDSTSFQYAFTGQFGIGPVEVTYLPGSFAETDGGDGTVNTNIEVVQSFTVVGPTAQLLDKNVDVALLNERGYLDVQYDASHGATLVESSLTDADPEFTLSNGVAVNGVPTNPSGDGVTWRYTFEDDFQPGEVTLEFAPDAWNDTFGTPESEVFNVAQSEILTVLGPTAQLIGPDTGLADVTLPSIDLMFRPTWGNVLNDSIVPEFTLAGSAVSQGVTVGEPTPLGNGVYRYPITGDLQPGQLQLEFAAGAIQDSTYSSLAQTQVITVVELTADLAYPLAGSRVTANDVNDRGYLDVAFADPLGVGLDKASILDPGPEIEVWAKDSSGNDIQIDVKDDEVSVVDGNYRYELASPLPIGPVTVKYLAGSWEDNAGNLGSAGEQSFLTTASAATLSLYVGGSVDLFAGTEDLRLLHIGGEVLLQAEAGVQGSRVQVDMNGQIDLIYLGTVGAAAGRFVLEIPNDDDAGMWGVLRIDSNFQKLEDLGFHLDAYCLLQINTTDEAKSETLTLPGQAEDGSDLTETFEIGPEMFRIEAGGHLTLAPLGAVTADGYFDVSNAGMVGSLQLTAGLTLGPMTVLGAAQFEINTTDTDVEIQRYEFNFDTRKVSDEKVDVTLPAGTTRIFVGGLMELEGSFTLEGEFEFVNSDDVISLDVDARFDAFDSCYLAVDGSARIVKGNAPGLVISLDAEAEVDFGISGVFNLDADFELKVNTRGGAGQDDYDLDIERNTFLVAAKGELDLLSVLTLDGSAEIRVADGVFSMDVTMGVDFFGIGWLNASGFFSSEGEFKIEVAGGVRLGVAGTGLFGNGKLAISRLDDNKELPHGDQDFVLAVSGYFDVRVELFHVTLAGAHLDANYNSESGRISVRAGVKFLFWKKYRTFYVGAMKYEPTYLAGNVDDQVGTVFRGGELYLNMGPRAELRDVSKDETDEFFTVKYLGPTEGREGYDVRVSGMGRRTDYQGVTKIIADGGDGDDLIRILPGMPIPVVLRGGAGADVLEVGDRTLCELVDGGEGDDEVLIVGDDSRQDLRVTIDDHSLVWIGSYDDDVELNSVPVSAIETIRLLGGEGADYFSISGELDLGGVGGVVVDMSTVNSESSQIPDGELDEVHLALSDNSDEFHFIPFEIGAQGIWKDHFTVDVLGGCAPDEDKVRVFTGGGDDHARVFFDPQHYEGVAAADGSINLEEFYLTRTEDDSRVGLTCSFEETETLAVTDAVVVDIADDVNNGNFAPGDLSLREAIELTNGSLAINNIFFRPDVALSPIELESDTLSITDALAITGPSVRPLTISGKDKRQIFTVDDHDPATTLSVDINGLTLVRGHGGLGGGIHNLENLLVEDCVILGNVAGIDGGGVYSAGPNFSVLKSTVVGNKAYGNGGGICSQSDLFVVESTIAENKADKNNNNTGDGGGIYIDDALLSVVDSAILDNWTGTHAGGICITSNGTAEVDNSTISGNSAEGHGGGVCNYGTLTVTNSTITGNTADSNNSNYGDGGGIYNAGSLSLNDSTISDNLGYNLGAGIFIAPNSDATVNASTVSGNSAEGHGGGIYNRGTLVLDASTIFDNTADSNRNTEGYGGGICNYGGTATIENSTISSNDTTDENGGGGIMNVVGTLVVANSTISDNTAAYHGGGICNYQGKVTVANSTIAGNSAGYSGGGIVNWQGGTLNVTNSTIVHNIANSDNNSTGAGGGIRTSHEGTNRTTLYNTIVAHNVSRTDTKRHADDLSGAVQSESSHNLIGDSASSSSLADGVNGNMVGQDPLLATLADNGGPTQTIALLSGSPAINAGSNDNAAGLTTDQRGTGFPRNAYATVDIGAFELQDLAPTVDAGEDQEVVEGSTVNLVASFAFEWAGETHTAMIDWGDGAVEAGTITQAANTGEIAGSHLYADDGNFTVTVTVTDDGGNSDDDLLLVNVNNADPAITNVQLDREMVQAGVPLTVNGSFTDAGSLDQHTVTVDWGDTTTAKATVDPATRTFTATHQYAGIEDYVVKVTVEDDDDGKGSDSVPLPMVKPLGKVLFSDDLKGLNSSVRDLWYQVEAPKTALLTLQASSAGPADAMALTLYDKDLNELDKSSEDAGNQRIDLPVIAGKEYFFRLSGTAENVDVALANLVRHDGTTMTVFGTDDDDHYKFNANTDWRLEINGLHYTFDRDEVSEITFDMGAGIDTVQLDDSPGNDTVEAGYRWVTATGPGYSLDGSNFEFLFAYASAKGVDKVVLHDSSRNNKFKSKPTEDFAMMYCGDICNRAESFEIVEADFSEGGRVEKACIWDTPYDDIFEGMPGDFRFYSSQTNHDITIRGVDLVTVFSTAGGDDRLVLHDTPRDDVLRARSHKIQMFNRNAEDPAYLLTARNFEDITVMADKGGDNDIAKLHDSTLDSLWEAGWQDGKTWSVMSSSARQLYEVFAFEQVKGYAHDGGQSVLKKNTTVDFIMKWGEWDDWVQNS